MKYNFTRLFSAIIVIVVFYASCKKAENSPVAKTTTSIDYASLSSTIALNLYQSINGKYGGTNINDGIQAPASLSANHSAHVLYSTGPMCGFTIDTSWTTKATAGDTAKTFGGNFKFVYTCSTNAVNGYIVHDSVTNTENSALFSNTFIVSQNYAVVATDSTYKVVSMNGNIQTVSKNSILSGATTSGYHNLFAFYVLSGLNVNFKSGTGDITAGTATFTMSKTDLDPTAGSTPSSYNFAGTIVFLGNHTAKLTLDATHVYTVNLLTGVTTPV